MPIQIGKTLLLLCRKGTLQPEKPGETEENDGVVRKVYQIVVLTNGLMNGIIRTSTVKEQRNGWKR